MRSVLVRTGLISVFGAAVVAACGGGSEDTSTFDAGADAQGIVDDGGVGSDSSITFAGDSFFFPDTQATDPDVVHIVDTGPPAVCGDSVISPGETCDDGNKNPGDGCDASCKVEANFVCTTPGQACVSTVVCGDGKLSGPETCDDGNKIPGDGCSASCETEAGWKCPYVGAACFAVCGDGIKAGDEDCDDKNIIDGDGCSKSCRLEDGYKCPTPGALCTKTVCGDGVKEGSEQCDDGNIRAYDGCDPTCHKEPVCTPGAGCAAVCGDGVKLPLESCDDGNVRGGDGCSSVCAIETGFTCSVQTDPLPATIDLPIVYRDFIPSNQTNGHPDFEAYGCDSVSANLLASTLNASGRPVAVNLTRSAAGDPVNGNCTNTQLTSVASFAQWFTDGATNKPVISTLRLKKQPDTSYVFDSATDKPDGTTNASAQFFPLDNLGWTGISVPVAQQETMLTAVDGAKHNFAFTSEVTFWFTYDASAAAASLNFTGDDDVWVFINGKLAVDLGGLHPRLGDQPAGAPLGTVVLNAAKAAQLGLVDKGLYDIKVFQAERHTNASNYKLTLRGFLKSKSTCAPICGDGIKTRFEVCDDGAQNDKNVPPALPAYGKCGSDCKARGGFCGDGVVQAANGETCDDGVNNGLYGSCTPDCKAQGPRCGDGIVQPANGEACDDGTNAGGYGLCGVGCQFGPRCGDGIVQTLNGEQCDDANTNNNDGCTNDCKTSVVPIN